MNAPSTGGRKAITVRVSPETHERVQRHVDAEHRTLSAMAEILIVEALDARDAQSQPAPVRRHY